MQNLQETHREINSKRVGVMLREERRQQCKGESARQKKGEQKQGRAYSLVPETGSFWPRLYVYTPLLPLLVLLVEIVMQTAVGLLQYSEPRSRHMANSTWQSSISTSSGIGMHSCGITLNFQDVCLRVEARGKAREN